MTLNGVMAVLHCVILTNFVNVRSNSHNRFLERWIYWSRVNFYNTFRAVKFVCVTKFTHSRVNTTGKSVDVTLPLCFDAWLPFDIFMFAQSVATPCWAVWGVETQCFVVHVRCRRKKSSRSLSHLLMSFLSNEPKMNNVRCRTSPLGLKTQNGRFPCKIALRLKKVSYKVRWRPSR